MYTYPLVLAKSHLYSIFTWKKRLYKDEPFDNYAILTFDLEDIEYISRYDAAGDCFIREAIPPENIDIIQFKQRETSKSKDSLENIFSTNMRSKAIEFMQINYEICEQPISELCIEKPVLDSDTKKKIIEELADYEHKKWSEEHNGIDWKAHKNKDGSLEISEQDIERIQKYSNLNYEQTEEFYKKDIRKAVMESFFIMQEHNMIRDLGIEDEELISILEQTEHMRRNGWSKYMLSLCSVNDGKYVIPPDRAKWWKQEMRTPYSELSEKQKESDRKEVYTIFSEIQKYKFDKQESTPLQKKEAKLAKLEKEQQSIGTEKPLTEQEKE